jgi:hypothetical protein
MPNSIKVHVEMADTDGPRGSTNCSYVHKTDFEMPPSASRLAIIRRAKREIGCGFRTITQDYGTYLRLDCIGACIAVLIDIEFA